MNLLPDKLSDFGDRITFLIVPIFCIGYMWIAIENRNSEEQREKIAEQNQYINILSAENERNRIGRDLHDSLGHTFAMMTLKTELALKLLEKRNYRSLCFGVALEQENTMLKRALRHPLISSFLSKLEREFLRILLIQVVE